jgi:hypothetical protein
MFCIGREGVAMYAVYQQVFLALVTYVVIWGVHRALDFLFRRK